MKTKDIEKAIKNAITVEYSTVTPEEEGKVETNGTKKKGEKKLFRKTTRAERMTKLATLNSRTYIFLRGMGINPKGLSKKVNGEVQANGKKWEEAPKAEETHEEEKASVIFQPITNTTEVVKKEEKKEKVEATQQAKTEQPKKEEKKSEPTVVTVEDDVEPETEMEKVLKPKKNYRANGKKGRLFAKAAAEAARAAAKKSA